jgi:ankyrin repeat protein
MVSSKPLRVEEVADVFGINFDEEISGIPKFEPSWRGANAETAVLSACSTLVAIVDGAWGNKVVQFSHFSVQEYLTSDRIANAEHVSRFHLCPKPAHTLLAKSCLSALLHLDYSIDKVKIRNFPLAEYAARCWVKHALFDDVSSYIRDGMDLLFDKDKPHFSTWVLVWDMDDSSNHHIVYDARPEELNLVPLYYAALCGFRGLVERLLNAHPQDLDRGPVYDNMSTERRTGLYIASSRGHVDVVRLLVDRGANLNAGCNDWNGDFQRVRWTPLHAAIYGDHPDIALFLLERGANPETRDCSQTALCIASSRGQADVVRSLIDRGADLNAKSHCWLDGPDSDDVECAPLHAATYEGQRDIALLLLERGADPETRSSWDETALHVASSRGCADIVQQLLTHGADPNVECKGWTPLDEASSHGRPEIVRMLLEHGADPNRVDPLSGPALHMASDTTVVELLLEYGVNVDVRGEGGYTPLHEAAHNLKLQVLVVLLNRGADPRALTEFGETALQLANTPPSWVSKKDQAQIIRLLSEHTGESM